MVKETWIHFTSIHALTSYLERKPDKSSIKIDKFRVTLNSKTKRSLKTIFLSIEESPLAQ